MLYCPRSKSTTCLCHNCTLKTIPCLQPYHSSVFERHVYIAESSVHGYGLFARSPIRVKDIICLYSGDRRSSAIEGNDYICKVTSCVQGVEPFFIDGKDKPYYSGRWANHSNFPNARLVVPLGGVISCHDNKKCAILVECIKPIEKDEEIFIDYGHGYSRRNYGRQSL